MRVHRFADLADKVRADPERARRVAVYKEELLQALSLAELRAARQGTQADLARTLKTTQSGVSRLEHQTDLYVSTLRSYLEALGGKLEIYGVFPDARVPITSFAEVGQAHDEGSRQGLPTTQPAVIAEH